MSDRFFKIQELPENLYTRGAPVLVVAGALLHDVKTGNAVAQLKFQNISTRAILSVGVSLAAYNSSKEEIEGKSDYQYFGLSMEPGQSFGDNKAIVMPRGETKSVQITGLEVTFQDGSNWRMGEEGVLQSQFTRSPIKNVLQEERLLEEYRSVVYQYANTVPQQSDSVWLCSCGTVNLGEECLKCRADKQKVFELCDSEYLNARIEAREEQKRREREEKIAVAKEKADALVMQGRQIVTDKKAKKGIVIGLLAVVVMAIAVGASIFMDQTEQTTVESSVADELIQETDEYLELFLALIGRDVSGGDAIEVSDEFLEKVNSVRIMGRSGSVHHGFSNSWTTQIDTMEWTDNDSATKQEFNDFLQALRQYYGKQEDGVRPYDGFSDETHVWIDDKNELYVVCWREKGVINMMWQDQDTAEF